MILSTDRNCATPVVRLRRRAKTVRTGLVGCGYWGPKLARNLDRTPGAKLTIACDLDLDRATDLQRSYPHIRTTSNFQQLLASDVDAIAIATPVRTHYSLAKAALNAGKHVLIEKPLATCSVQAQELVSLARRQGLTLMVGHTFEYNRAVEAIRQIVRSGELGRIHYIDCIRVNLGLLRSDINVIWDLAPHDLSILRYILGCDPMSISACGKSCIQADRQIHDVASLSLHFPGGILATLRLSWLEPVKIRRSMVVGSRKTLAYDDTAENKILIYDRGIDAIATTDKRAGNWSYRRGEASTYPIDWVEPLGAQTQHFIDCIRQQRSPRSNGEVGANIVRLLEAAQASLDNDGQSILLSPAPDVNLTAAR